MLNIRKKEQSPKEKRRRTLKEEIRNCEKMIRRAQSLFELSTDGDLIEARIYELKSLNKHYDYLISCARRLEETEEKDFRQAINV